MDVKRGALKHPPRQNDRKVPRRWLVFVLVFAVLFAIARINWSYFFPVTTVRVYGARQIDRQEVQDLLVPLVSQGFFSVDLETARDRLIQNPWVVDLYLRRTWPNKVDIVLNERRAVAVWNNDCLLSTEGELFCPKKQTYPAILPHFVGPSGQHIVMLDYFNQMNRILNPLHAKISFLEFTANLTWKLALDNGMVLQMGNKDVLTRLGQFVKVYPKIVEGRVADVDYVDLRYSNGVAVRWKAPIKT